MAVPEDYVGKRFGYIYIARHLDFGGTAEVFGCVHLPSRNLYALRLSIEDDALWEEEPLLPPRNGDFERRAATVNWDLNNSEKPGWFRGVPMFYQVVDQRFIIPLGSPWRLKNALDVMQVNGLRDAAQEKLGSFSLYSDTVIAMLADIIYGRLKKKDFLSKWGMLTGGVHLLATAQSAVEGQVGAAKVRGLAGAPKSSRALELLALPGNHPKSLLIDNESVDIESLCLEFAENKLLWLCIAAAYGLISADEFLATLMCRWFRLNISTHEVAQLSTIHNMLLQDLPYYKSDTINLSKEWTGKVLGCLHARAYTPRKHRKSFIKAQIEPPTVASDWLVLQDLAGSDWYEKGGVLVR